MEGLLFFVHSDFFFRDVCRCWCCWLHIITSGNNMCFFFGDKCQGKEENQGLRSAVFVCLTCIVWCDLDLTSQPVLFWCIHWLFSCDINKTCFRHENPSYLSFFCKSAPVTPEWTQENCRTMTPNETVEASERALKRSDQVGRCEGDVMFMPSLQGFVG